jgi:hypothetical protein
MEDDIVVVATGNSFIAAEASPHGFYQGGLPSQFPGDMSRAIFLGDDFENPPTSPLVGQITPTGEFWYSINLDAICTIQSGNIVANVFGIFNNSLSLNESLTTGEFTFSVDSDNPIGNYLQILGNPGETFSISIELV